MSAKTKAASPKSSKSSKPCNCWTTTSEKLADMGFKFIRTLEAFEVQQGLGLKHQLLLPLMRVDGKPLRRGDPSSVQMKHCPFCGAKL